MTLYDFSLGMVVFSLSAVVLGFSVVVLVLDVVVGIGVVGVLIHHIVGLQVEP